MSTAERHSIAPSHASLPAPDPRDVVSAASSTLRHTRRLDLRRHWPRWLLAVIAVLLLLAAVDSFAGEVVFSQRQHQRAADFKKPRNYTAGGRAIAVLQIPKLGMNLVVAEGTNASTLRGGPGHLPASAVPGASGNAVVLGHRTHFGGPFGKLTSLKKGDSIFVQPKGSPDVVEYTVTDVARGDAAKLTLLDPTDDPRLTLVTSDSGPLTDRRVIVSATASQAAQKPPAGTRTPRPADGFEPDSSLVSGNLLLAACWLAMAIAVVGTFRYRYQPWVLAIAGGIPILLGLTLFWFEIDRWLPSTL